METNNSFCFERPTNELDTLYDYTKREETN